ncbi:glutathione S-transferase family protein [Nostocaceae cyanobacterium CENA357]|uniref:Glutathione S-transferase family protein n=1 Tax=Atlanticothrix silvestris CENA357 TaxID=1725252 RepID=A0A8J7HI54_9CYAN|nr:glutathione S-transferase family protein [Atlanticothrix silvestris]MBH8552970.1 glutathione S-transferase family protein [Atlanticothrix silvestris CENA357]
MLKFYYNPRSPMARRVWRTLLEKEISFESVILNLNGDQLQSEFLAINPFHHVPVIVDQGFRVIESLAILDYLETKYPTPALLPTEAEALAIVRMVQMTVTNELLPKAIYLMFETEDSPKLLQAKEHIDKVLNFLTECLGNSPYFASEQLTLADIVAGTDMSLLSKSGFSFNNYPKLKDWFERLMQREIWQRTELNQEDFEKFKRVLRIMRRRKLSQENKIKN